MANQLVQKSYADTYLYNRYPAYEKNIIEFITKAHVIDKNSDGFDDIRYDIKRRQVSSALVKVFDSKKIILLIGEKALPKTFKVICAKDIKNANGDKVIYIDCTGLIAQKDGKYIAGNVDIFIAYLVSAMTQTIYYHDAKRILNIDAILNNGARCYSALFTNIVDYLYHISSSYGLKDKCVYLSVLFYGVNMLGKEFDDRLKYLASSISGISEREADMLMVAIEPNDFTNIKTFVNAVGKTLKLSKFTLDAFLEKWMYLYGPGTIFGTELFISFAEMLSDAYVGCYINNQKTIEKVTGTNMVSFVTSGILRAGSEAV